MTYLRLNSFISILFVGLFVVPRSLYAKQYIDGRQLQGVLQNLGQSKIPSYPDSHPDFAISKTLEALQFEKQGNPSKVIEVLEPVLVKKNFDGKKESYRLSVDTLGSFSLWRETMYMSLARAYYQIGNHAAAEYFFKGVPKNSTYHRYALLGLTWALLAQEKFELARTAISEMNDPSIGFSTMQKNEKLVQEAYLAVITGNPDQAIQLANRYRGSNKTLVGISRSKVLAQAYFEKYLKNVDTSNFAQKRKLLGKVIQISEAVPQSSRDANFAFFGGEVYWHLASAYRIEDPEKYLKLTRRYLAKSGQWLEPWVLKSLKDKKAYLAEDAWFFSIALLWEQDRFKEATPRLRQAEALYPQGEYRQDAYQLLADYYYDTGKFKDAIYYYRKLSLTGNAEKSAYGVYKAAWSFYNMDDKWAALRHLERLMFFYEEESQNTDDLPAGNLAKEARKDMLIVMAELMNSRAALREIRIFDLEGDDHLEIQDDLANAYLKIGRYEESSKVWLALLQQYPKTPKTFAWLEGVLRAQLASGQRRVIAPTMVKFYKRLPAKADFEKEHESFQKSVVNIALTMHKESRKTNDPDIWRATDQIYSSLVQLYPNHQQADIWFYGAQRKESLKKLGEAIEWYQKAASVPKYANAKDAAYSILRIAKDLADSESLKKGGSSKKNYQRLANSTLWYIENFKNTKQRGLAEFLLLEAYFYLGQFSKANAYLTQVFAEEGPTKEHQNQYYAHNRLLYKTKNWSQAHLSAIAVTSALSDRPKKGAFYKKVAKIEQESAFQYGFEVEKKNKIKAREWYLKSISQNADPIVTLKAWNNLFSTFKLPKEQAEFFDAFSEFEDGIDLKFVKKESNRKLVFNVFLKAIENAEKSLLVNEKIDLIFNAAKFAPAKEKANLKWDALTHAGNFYALPKMKQIIVSMQRQNRAFISSDDKRLTIARLFFWNGDYKNSFAWIKGMLQKKNPPAGAWILIRDLYTITSEIQSPVGDLVSNFLIENHDALKREPLLKPIWASILYPDFGTEQAKQWESVGFRKVASISPNATKGPVAVQFKTRLNEVSKTLKQLEAQENEIKEYLDSPAPQVTVAALCIVPRFRNEAVKRLKKLESPPIKSKQWGAFLGKLRSKAREISQVAKKEESICNQQKRIIAYMPPLVKTASPLCNGPRCFPLKPSGLPELLELRRQNPRGMKAKLDLVNQMIELGGWGIAEDYAYSIKSISEREVILGFLRLAMGDSWNAVPLLRAAKKSKFAEPHARLLLSRILWRHGNRALASTELKGVKSKDLLEWENDLFIELVTDLRRRSR